MSHLSWKELFPSKLSFVIFVSYILLFVGQVFDPTTYYLLLQLRVVVTGILFQVIFSKTLSRKQWLSLIILTFGCMLKQINFTEDKPSNQKSTSFDIGLNGVFILIQIFCSCLAGVYNEYLLKKQGADVNIFIQNIFMYLDSIVCNVVLLTVRGNLLSAFTYNSLVKVFHYKVLLVMFNNAAIGIVTSFFLKTLNSILKTFASALELILTAVLSYLLFSIPIYLNTVLAIATVMFAVYLYSQNPVSNPPKASRPDKSDQASLIKSEE
ncbi:CMP-sialic acid transporter 1, partial [Asbolus verrucosus]